MLLGLQGHLVHVCRKVLTSTAPQCSVRRMSQSLKMDSKLIAVAQMTSVQDKEQNFQTCISLVQKASAAGAKMVFFPEACDYIAENKDASLQLAESMEGDMVSRYRDLAQSADVWLSLGGIHLKEEGEDKISNTHLVIDNKGDIVSSYIKTHLFSVHIPERNLHLEESNYVMGGNAVHPPVATPVGQLALGICYDLRFPEMSLIQRNLGSEILTYPSAFTVPTGLAHWEALLRARAIETQCYVIAAAQTGQHNSKRASYGHAMIVDPWGAVIGQAHEGTNIVLAEIDLEYLRKVREEMPVLTHRRHDLYTLERVANPNVPSLCQLMALPSPYVNYQFGQVFVPGSCIFLKSKLSQAFVNKKPVVPGHILISPERPAKTLADMTPSEVCDIAQMTQKAVKVILKEYHTQYYNVAIQDGPAAGQTIKHLHIHVLPKPRDGVKLQGHEHRNNSWREICEMEKEATKLRETAAEIYPSLVAVDDIPKSLKLMELGDAVTSVPQELIVGRTENTFAYVAPQPVLPGHVSVSLLDQSKGFVDASCSQIYDLFMMTQLVQKKLGQMEATVSFTIMHFNKVDTGDGSKTVEVHIIPRKDGDLENNDDIYESVQECAGRMANAQPSEELKSIANKLRQLLYE